MCRGISVDARNSQGPSIFRAERVRLESAISGVGAPFGIDADQLYRFDRAEMIAFFELELPPIANKTHLTFRR
jgi:hypothetical protein